MSEPQQTTNKAILTAPQGSPAAPSVAPRSPLTTHSSRQQDDSHTRRHSRSRSRSPDRQGRSRSRSHDRSRHQQRRTRSRSRSPGAAMSAAAADTTAAHSSHPSNHHSRPAPSQQPWRPHAAASSASAAAPSAAAADVILSPPLHIRRQKIDELASASAIASSAAALSTAATPAAASSDSAAASAASQPKRDAFVVLVMLGDSYVPGALVLAHSIRSAGSRAALVVMVSHDVSESARADLALLFDEVVEVPLIEGRAIHKEWKRYTKLGAGGGAPMYQWLDKCFTKFNVLTLTQYERVCLLDADMLCVAPPDAIWDLRAPAGLCSTIVDAAGNAASHGQRLSEAQVDASLRSYGMRGCLYMLRPSLSHYQLVRDTLTEFGGYGERCFHVGADEKLMTDLYADEWTHVNWAFGSNSWKCTPEELGRPPVFLHFVTEKPWQPKEVWPDTYRWNTSAKALMQAYPQVAPRFAIHLEAIQRHEEQQQRRHHQPQQHQQQQEQWQPRPQWQHQQQRHYQPHPQPHHQYQQHQRPYQPYQQQPPSQQGGGRWSSSSNQDRRR